MEADHEDSSEPADPEDGERDEDLALVFCCPRHSGIGEVKMETIMQVGLSLVKICHVTLVLASDWLKMETIMQVCLQCHCHAQGPPFSLKFINLREALRYVKGTHSPPQPNN